MLKSTGITRKIDELGRIVIPKEIRRNLGIRDGENLEIFTDSENIILKKYSSIKGFEDLGEKLCEIISNIFDVDVIITDREKIVASNKEFVDKRLGTNLINLIDNRESLITDSEKVLEIENINICGYLTIVPIIVESDSLGLVILVSKDKTLEKLAKLIAKIMTEKINIY